MWHHGLALTFHLINDRNELTTPSGGHTGHVNVANAMGGMSNIA